MSTTLNRAAFERLVKENLEWLLEQPRTLERDHIEAILKDAPLAQYTFSLEIAILRALQNESQRWFTVQDICGLREVKEGREAVKRTLDYLAVRELIQCVNDGYKGDLYTSKTGVDC